MTTSTAINVFAKAVVRERKIPDCFTRTRNYKRRIVRAWKYNKMMDNKYSKLVNLAAKILYVYSAQCKYCNYTFDYVAEITDTDMLSCYCGSVYSLSDRQLVIAPLTTEEFYNGQLGRLDIRINAICTNHNYKYYGNMICSCCGKPTTPKSEKGISLKDYCAIHPNTLIIYTDGTIRTLKLELEANHI